VIGPALNVSAITDAANNDFCVVNIFNNFPLVLIFNLDMNFNIRSAF
jgi:hypothetical protein